MQTARYRAVLLTVDFGHRRSFEGEKGKKKRKRRKKKKKKNTSCRPRPHAVAARGRFFSRTGRKIEA
ncbi:hypothetical protein BHM03_00052322, partial [Ensete ventricosum]